MKLKKAGCKVYICGVLSNYKRTVWLTDDYKEVVKINGAIVHLDNLRRNKFYSIFYVHE